MALVEGGAPVVVRVSESEGAHGERLMPLLEQALAESGWARSSLDRVGVGVGPGSFTGIRVGVALGSGIALGLGRPLFGVGALQAMCRAVPGSRAGSRCAVLDARRGEIFAAVYSDAGVELVAPLTLPRQALARWLAGLGTRASVIVGEALGELEPLPEAFRSELTDLPHAVAVALVAEGQPEGEGRAEPAYVRLPDVTPSAARSPVSSGDSR